MLIAALAILIAPARAPTMAAELLGRMGVVRYGTGYPCPPQEGGPPLRP
ncbi:MAG: hypothetical protein ACE5JM_01115 [Armatimonadota bacterium]